MPVSFDQKNFTESHRLYRQLLDLKMSPLGSPLECCLDFVAQIRDLYCRLKDNGQDPGEVAMVNALHNGVVHNQDISFAITDLSSSDAHFDESVINLQEIFGRLTSVQKVEEERAIQVNALRATFTPAVPQSSCQVFETLVIIPLSLLGHDAPRCFKLYRHLKPQDKPTSSSAASQFAVSERESNELFVERRTRNYCHIKGHIVANCPSIKKQKEDSIELVSRPSLWLRIESVNG